MSSSVVLLERYGQNVHSTWREQVIARREPTGSYSLQLVSIGDEDGTHVWPPSVGISNPTNFLRELERVAEISGFSDLWEEGLESAFEALTQLDPRFSSRVVSAFDIEKLEEEYSSDAILMAEKFVRGLETNIYHGVTGGMNNRIRWREVTEYVLRYVDEFGLLPVGNHQIGSLGIDFPGKN
jgi:hypothetical protein